MRDEAEHPTSRRPHQVCPARASARVILAIKNFAHIPGVCVAEGEWVATERGYRRIEDVEVGAQVWVQGALKRVVNKVCNGVRGTVWVTTAHGYRTRATADHRFLTMDETSQPARSLAIGQELVLNFWEGGNDRPALPRCEWVSKRTAAHARWCKPETIPTIPERIDPEIAWLLGYFAGDGNVSLATERYGGKVRFTVAVHEAYALDLPIRQIVADRFGLTAPTHDRNGGKAAYNLAYNSSSWAQWIAGLGLKQGVPSIIFEAGEDVRCAFLRGFFDADGSASGSHGFTCVKKNPSVIRGLQLLLLGSRIESHVGVGHGDLCVRVRGYESEKRFAERVGFTIPHKREVRVERNPNAAAYRRFRYGVSAFEGLAPAEPARVWDLEVEDAHHFSAGGLTVHNCHIGLGVTALNTQRVLRRHGIDCQAWSAQTAPELETKIAADFARHPARPVTHVIVSAPSWIQPGDFARFSQRWPDTEFVQLNHSGTAYLSIDKYGIRNIREVLALEQALHNVRVAGNNLRFCHWLHGAFGQHAVYLPNLYDTTLFVEPLVSRQNHDPLRIGSFGAARPWKNQLTAAESAVQLGRRLAVPFELYVNTKRPDGGERMIEARKELFDKLPYAKLIEVPWQLWPHFRQTVRMMDIMFSPSFDETFNVVVADGIAEGCPSVVTPAIEWTPHSWQCEPWDPSSVTRVALGLLHDRVGAVHDARRKLTHFVQDGINHWVRYLTRNAEWV